MERITEEQWEGLIDRLKKGGCPVRRLHGYKMPPKGLAIEKPPWPILNQVSDILAGGTCYVMEFALHNELDRTIDVQGFQLVTPWGTPQLSVLPAPRKSHFAWPYYILPDGSSYFDAGYILNPIFARRKTRLGPDERVQGLLVALDKDSIPEEIADRAHIPVTLAVFDSRRNRYAARCEMWVDRSALRARAWQAEQRAASERYLAECHRKQKNRSTAEPLPKQPEDNGGPKGTDYQYDLVCT